MSQAIKYSREELYEKYKDSDPLLAKKFFNKGDLVVHFVAGAGCAITGIKMYAKRVFGWNACAIS